MPIWKLCRTIAHNAIYDSSQLTGSWGSQVLQRELICWVDKCTYDVLSVNLSLYLLFFWFNCDCYYCNIVIPWFWSHHQFISNNEVISTEKILILIRESQSSFVIKAMRRWRRKKEWRQLKFRTRWTVCRGFSLTSRCSSWPCTSQSLINTM